MLAVTDRAGDYLVQVLNQSKIADDSIVRFVEDSGKVKVVIDQKQEGDVIITQDDKEIIALDEEVASSLGDRTVDLDEDDDGLKLILL
jgi:hypothetical protein